MKVVSSIIAAWSDVTNALTQSIPGVSTGISAGAMKNLLSSVRGLNVGYLWMLFNCLASAAYVGHLVREFCEFLFEPLVS